MTAQEILDSIEKSGMTIDQFAYDDYNKEAFEATGGWEEVEQYGGEGQGDTWYSVKYFPDHDVYIRIDGFYTSYHGTDFYDGLGREVRPQEKTITVYE